MAKKKTKAKPKKVTKLKKPSFKLSSQQKLVFGSFLVILGLLLFIAFLSYFFTGKIDQSALSEFTSRDVETENWVSIIGAKGFFRLVSFTIWLARSLNSSGVKRSRILPPSS